MSGPASSERATGSPVLGPDTVGLIFTLTSRHADLSKQSLIGWLEVLANRDSRNYETIFRMGVEEAEVKWAGGELRTFPGYLHHCLFADGTGHQHADMIDPDESFERGHIDWSGDPY